MYSHSCHRIYHREDRQQVAAGWRCLRLAVEQESELGSLETAGLRSGDHLLHQSLLAAPRVLRSRYTSCHPPHYKKEGKEMMIISLGASFKIPYEKQGNILQQKAELFHSHMRIGICFMFSISSDLNFPDRDPALDECGRRFVVHTGQRRYVAN